MSLTVCAALFSACGDFLETGSNRVVFEEDNTLSSANDSVYSVMGILQTLEYIGDRTVLLGELRGELMTVTENADVSLQEINNFDVSADNPYASTKEYYRVINNCNYFIQHVDTTIVSAGRYTLLNEYAAVKAIRAWTYFQLGLAYGKVVYVDKPILSLEDMNASYPTLQLYELIDKLIAELEPYSAPTFSAPTYAEQCYVPIQLLLADLYLWKGDFANAASYYYQVISRNATAMLTTWGSEYMSDDFLNYDNSFSNFFDYDNRAMLAYLKFAPDYGMKSQLPYLMLPENGFMTVSASGSSMNVTSVEGSRQLTYSQAAADYWNSEMYTYYTASTRTLKYISGDLRFKGGSVSVADVSEGDTTFFIRKFVDEEHIPLYRGSLVWLRYAEAINQYGYPATAFAVLKYGLSPSTFTDVSAVPSWEKNSSTPDFIRLLYGNTYQGNLGIRYHGLGACAYDTVYFKIPTLETKQDSINYVDEIICKELALETAFEGNRFPDLVRFADRRGDPAFLATRLAKKNPALEAKLLSRDNWFLPWKD
jgi:tetratricopeptide (TPR) repeat protein